jgi:hypothetical protein
MCVHEDCGGKEKVWLPFIVRGLYRGLKPHSYCKHCGLIKNLAERARNSGYYLNIVAKMERHLQKRRITKVQLRLIAKELECSEFFNDEYGVSKTNQDRVFIDIVQKYCNFSETFITRFL